MADGLTTGSRRPQWPLSTSAASPGPGSVDPRLWAEPAVSRPLATCTPLSVQEGLDANSAKARWRHPHLPTHPLPLVWTAGVKERAFASCCYSAPVGRRNDGKEAAQALRILCPPRPRHTFRRAFSPAALFSRPMYSLPSFSHMEATLREYRG